MYTVNSVRKYFERRPQFNYMRDRMVTIAESKANDMGLITSADDWSWLTDNVGQDFFGECARHPMIMFKDDLHLAAIPFLRIEEESFPGAKEGDIVIEGKVMLQMGGIEGNYNFDVEIIRPDSSPTTYWHPNLLRGWGGKVQVVIHMREGQEAVFEIRQAN